MDSNLQYNKDNHSNASMSLDGSQCKHQKSVSGSIPGIIKNREVKNTFLGFKRFTRTYSLADVKGQAKIKVWESNDNKNCFLQVSHFKYKNQVEIKHSDIKANGQLNLFNEEDTLLKKEKFIVEELVADSFKDNSANKKLWKVVKLKNIPKNTGVNSIVSQISGGPLENIILERSKPLSESLTSIVVEFVQQRDADQFMKLSKTNFFKINGQHFSFDWARQERFSEMNSSKLEEIPTENEPNFEKKLKDVSRILIMKRVTNRKKMIKLSIDSETPLQSLNIEDIRNDFLKYGPIQDITPVISKTLCISVIFLNRKSAMNAMNDLNNEKSRIHSKYSKYWTIWYGKDITDRPVFIL